MGIVMSGGWTGLIMRCQRMVGLGVVVPPCPTSGIGRYGVAPHRLIPLIDEELARPPRTVDAFLIDEIGKMECHCPQFVATMRELLDGPIPVLVTIALRGGGFIAEVKQRPCVQVVEVTQANRQALPGQIAAWVKERTVQANAL